MVSQKVELLTFFKLWRPPGEYLAFEPLALKSSRVTIAIVRFVLTPKVLQRWKCVGLQRTKVKEVIRLTVDE